MSEGHRPFDISEYDKNDKLLRLDFKLSENKVSPFTANFFSSISMSNLWRWFMQKSTYIPLVEERISQWAKNSSALWKTALAKRTIMFKMQYNGNASEFQLIMNEIHPMTRLCVLLFICMSNKLSKSADQIISFVCCYALKLFWIQVFMVYINLIFCLVTISISHVIMCCSWLSDLIKE